MQKWRNWEAAGEADWLLALKRQSVTAQLAARSKVGVRRVDEAALQVGLGRSVLSPICSSATGSGSQSSSLLPGKRVLTWMARVSHGRPIGHRFCWSTTMTSTGV